MKSRPFMTQVGLWLVLSLTMLGSSGCSMLKSGRGAAVVPPPVVAAAAVTNAGVVTRPVVAPRIGDSAVASRAPYRLRYGDPVIIFLRGILPKDDQIEDIVDERGYVTLPYVDDVLAAGRTSSELEREIQRIYIERQIYRSVTVSVVSPSQSFFVQGEVRLPQRYPLVSGTTVLQAIAAAGGYTEYAEPRKVSLTRGRDVKVINMRDVERNPQQDLSVESGDVIRVPRSIF